MPYFNRCWVIGWGLLWLLSQAAGLSSVIGDEVDFAKEIEPIFRQRCIQCHGAEKQKGSLRLDDKTLALTGGDSGAVIVPSKPTESELLRRVTSSDKLDQMPPEGERLTAEQIAALTRWIAAGANWPAEPTDPALDKINWWSLKPLTRAKVPQPAPQALAPIRNPIDAFVQAKLAEQGLAPSPEADRRTLLRRLKFDLLGLPPTLAEIKAFEQDQAPQAYERLVDQLLQSTQYGERWARHWLDVVHYGDSHGYDKDKPRPNAWPYRDYVIRAFNSDKPYSRFVQEQLAGDVLYPGTAEGQEALGFLSAGPWDFIGHAELPETKIDGKIARHLDRDDMVATTFSTFMGLTVHCAQCHNHKFDPILHEDYYRLQAVFSALDRADKAYDSDPQTAAERGQLVAQSQKLKSEQQLLTQRLAEIGGAPLAELDAQLTELAKAAAKPAGARAVEFGYHSQLETVADKPKWVQIDLGEIKPLDKIVLFGCFDDFGNIGAGFGFPPRFKLELCNAPEFASEVQLVTDHTSESTPFPNPGTKPQAFTAAGKAARYVRFTATTLATRTNDFHLALDEIEVLSPEGKNLARGAKVSALDSIEAIPRWSTKNLTDGIAYGKEASVENVAEKRLQLTGQRQALLTKVAPPELLAQIGQGELAAGEIARKLASLPPQKTAYVACVHTGSGNFVGTGASGGKPRPIFVLPRGDIKKPGKPVSAGPLQLLPGLPKEFSLPADASEGAARAALAQWITSKENPLTWRTIVNRVWLYHFGRGIVDSPSDFGHMGQLPTHPELLDYLAIEFRDGGQSLKNLHRQILTSHTYRQVSTDQPAFAEKDAGNQFYWRMNRRKLEAEAIRDSLLMVSGKLNPQMYGPAFQDFVVEHPEHSPHYEYELYDPENPTGQRRSIYRFLVRSQLQPFMTTLDCADPSLTVEKRTQTISPLQALAMLNNRLALAMAGHFAETVKAQAGDDPAAQVRVTIEMGLGREPSEAEAGLLKEYLSKNNLPALCRVILNLSEFVFVD